MQEAIDKLLALEKLTRNVRLQSSHLSSSSFPSQLTSSLVDPSPSLQAADLSSTSQILVTIPTLIYNSNADNKVALLNSSVVLLAKRHGQLKEAVVKMIDVSMGFLAEIKQKGHEKEWLELLETLRTVTEGKVRAIRAHKYDRR